MIPSTILLREVAKDLGYKNLRSAKRWCFYNGVRIISYKGTKRKYVDVIEYETVRNGESELILPLSNNQPKVNYNSQGRIEKEFLQTLTSI